MNGTAIETLERRLKVTRDAMAGELDRARNATAAAAKAEERAADYLPVIRDLEQAIDELRGWAPPVEAVPHDVPCPSCGALPGQPCRSPAGDVLDAPHVTRGAPA
jgi:hypothetical protein